MTSTPPSRHIVLVEAYDGQLEFLSDEPEKRAASEAMGLPIDEIAHAADCRVTILGWDDWFRYEAQEGSFLRWMPYPATRPISPPSVAARDFRVSDRITRVSIPARDPVSSHEFSRGLTPGTHGLLADSDALFVASYCLNIELDALYRRDPFGAVVVSMWGGSGFMPQLARATAMRPSVDVPFAVVVTDTSARRHAANEEGFWTRAGITRRQMEDLSLGLADLVLAFGPRGAALADAGRLPTASKVMLVPRRVDAATIDAIADAAERRTPPGADRQIFLYEPQQAASGVLAALDAVRTLGDRGVRLERPFVSAGPDMRFAPMQPMSFVEYWSSRGFVRELTCDGRWTWATTRPPADGTFPVRISPTVFDHLPAVWTELARGSLVLLSAAAAEGLVPGGSAPEAIALGDAPTATAMAAVLARVATTPAEELDAVRRQVCAGVADALRNPCRNTLLGDAATAVRRLVDAPPAPQDLGAVAMLLTDRRLPLRTLAEQCRESISAVDSSSAPPAAGALPPLIRLPVAEPPRPWWSLRRQRPRRDPVQTPGTITAAVTCYQLGPLLRETVESIWASARVPDEVLLIDDGSRDRETAQVIAGLQKAAAGGRHPLTVVRQPNQGLAGARNRALALARGELISFLDGDDLIDPSFYALAAQLLRRYPRLGGVACWAYCFGKGLPDTFWNAPQPELPLLLVENTVVVPCMMPTALLRELGGYDPDQRHNYEDWELSIRIVASGRPIVTIPAYLQRYRMRADSLYRTMTVAQNQTMREYLCRKHQQIVSRFGVEVAMQLEHQLARHRFSGKR